MFATQASRFRFSSANISIGSTAAQTQGESFAVSALVLALIGDFALDNFAVTFDILAPSGASVITSEALYEELLGQTSGWLRNCCNCSSDHWEYSLCNSDPASSLHTRKLGKYCSAIEQECSDGARHYSLQLLPLQAKASAILGQVRFRACAPRISRRHLA